MLKLAIKTLITIHSIILLSLSLFASNELGRQKISLLFQINSTKQIKVAFFDADSTLRVSKSGSVSANGSDDFEILPGTIQAIKQLNADGYFVAIVSNQAGIPKYVSLETADRALQNLVIEFAAQGATIHYYDFSESYDDMRKPNVGMAILLEQKLKQAFGEVTQIDRNHSFMVGDAAWKKGELRPDNRDGFNVSNSDRLFAENFKIEFKEPADFFGWRIHGYDIIESLEACKALLKTMNPT